MFSFKSLINQLAFRALHTLLFVSWVLLAHSQNKSSSTNGFLDSLKVALADATLPADKGEIAYELSNTYSDKYAYDSTIKYTHMTFEYFGLAGKGEQYRLWKNFNIIHALVNKGDLEKAFILKTKLQKAIEEVYDKGELKMQLESAVSRTYLAPSLNLLGEVYRKVGDLDQALLYYLRALEFGEETQIHSAILNATKNIGIVYDLKKEYQKSIQYYKSALAYQNRLKVALEDFEYPNFQLGSYHNNLGIAFKNLQAYDSSAFHYQKGLEIMAFLKIPYGEGVLLDNLGNLRKEQARYVEGIKYHKQALSIMEKLRSTQQMSLIQYNLAECYFESGQSEDSVLYFADRSYELAKKGNLPNELKDISGLLSRVYEKKADFKQAFKFQKLHKTLSDSLNSIEEREKLENIKTRFETEKTEKKLAVQNAQLEQQTTQRNALLIGLGLLGIISLLIYRSQRIKSKTNRQLKEAEALKNRWLANVSHELKTPLTLVQAPLTKVLDSARLNEIDRGNLRVANRSVKQLNRLVTEILDLSKLDKAQLTLQPSTIDYADVVRVTSYAFESLAISRGTKLSVQTDTFCWMHLDEHQIRKTFENLLTNALKFTKEGDKIVVSLTRGEETIDLTVTDTGMGISAEDIPHIFDRFYQAQDPAKSRIGGTGIGLSLTKEIIEMHEGTIDVKSKEGLETTFTISLPVSLLREAPKEKESIQKDATESLLASDSKYQEVLTELPRLLLVEDNDDMRNFLINDLKTTYTITKALDGKDALEKLRGTTFDVIITDVMMPRMDGNKLIHEVKKNPDWKKIPLIVLTALNSQEDRLGVLRTGVDDYITKPFNIEELKVRLHNLIINSKQRSDAEETDEKEDSLLASIEKNIKAHLADPEYSVKAMAENASMTERSLHRYLKKTTGLSPTGLITELKLQKAMQLLEKKSFRTLKEICSEIGYERTSRFSGAFEKRFGKRPSDYL